MARGLKFRIKKLEGLFYLCSENKGADQPRSYRYFVFANAKGLFSHDAVHMSVLAKYFTDSVGKHSTDSVAKHIAESVSRNIQILRPA